MFKNKKLIVIISCLGLIIIGGVVYYKLNNEVKVKTAMTQKELFIKSKQQTKTKQINDIFSLDDKEEFKFPYPLSREEKSIVKQAQQRIKFNNAITFYLSELNSKKRFGEMLVVNIKRATNSQSKEEMSKELLEANSRLDIRETETDLKEMGIDKNNIEEIVSLIQKDKLKSCENYLFNLRAINKSGTMNYYNIENYLKILYKSLYIDDITGIKVSFMKEVAQEVVSDEVRRNCVKKQLEYIGKQKKYLNPRQKRLYKQLCKAMKM